MMKIAKGILAKAGQLFIGNQPFGVVNVCNKSGGNFAANQLLYISGFDATLGLPIVSKADADTNATGAQYINPEAIANGKKGLVYEKYEVGGLNTNAGAVSDKVYLSATAGGWTLTPPNGADQVVQVVGFITVKSATVGKIVFLIQPRNITVYGSSAIQPGCITAVADNALGFVKHINDESHSIFFIAGEIDFGASEIVDTDLGVIGYKGTLIGGYCQLTEAQAGGDATTVLTLAIAAGGVTPIANTVTVTLANTADGQSNKVYATRAIDPVAGGVDIAATAHIYAYTPDDVAGTRSAGKMKFFLLFQKSA